MADYSAVDLAGAMRRAGFPLAAIPIGVAISLAENPSRVLTTVNHSSIEHSVGPWQINLYVPGTGRVVHGQAISEADAADLQKSTDYAYTLYQTQGWQPWSVFLNGSYQNHIAEGNAAVAAVPGEQAPTPPGQGAGAGIANGIGAAIGSAVSGATGAAQGPLDGLGTLIGNLSSRGWWARSGLLLGAVVLMLVGAGIMAVGLLPQEVKTAAVSAATKGVAA